MAAELIDIVAERNAEAREDCATLFANALEAFETGDRDALVAVLAQALCYVNDLTDYHSNVWASLATEGLR